MCLFCKENFSIKTAKKDLVFYKVLRIKGINNNTFYTPYKRMNVELNKQYTQKCDIFASTKCCDIFVEINEGVFHLFEKIEDAYAEKLFFLDGIVVRAIVPKGTKYVKGTYEFADCIGTKSVIYTELTDKETFHINSL